MACTVLTVSIKKELVAADGAEQAAILNANTIKKEIVDEVEDGNVDEFITRYNSYLSSMQSAKGKVSTKHAGCANAYIFHPSENYTNRTIVILP